MATPEDLFTTTLQRHADTVEAPTRRFGQEAYQAAGRVRRRRRITAAIGTAAVVVAAVPVGIGLVDLRVPNESIQPTQSQAPPKTVTIDVGALPRGSAPAVPWYFDSQVNIGERSFTVGQLSWQKTDQLSTAGDGFLISGSSGEVPSETRIFDREGKLVRTLPSGDAVVSPDGRTVVTAQPSRDKTTFIATDSASGDEIRRLVVPDPSARPAGFAGDRVVYTYVEKGSVAAKPTRSWDPRSGAETLVAGLHDVLLAGGQTRAATEATCGTVGSGSQLKVCQQVVDIADPRQVLWKDNLVVLSFSPDGRYAAAHEESENQGISKLVVYDLVERRLVLRLQGGYFAAQAAWEPDGSVLMIIEEAPLVPGTKDTIVRCSLEGACERAADTVALDTGFDPIYLLPKQG